MENTERIEVEWNHDMFSYLIYFNIGLLRITLEDWNFRVIIFKLCIILCAKVDPGGPVVIILATGSEIREFKPDWGRWSFSERKNPEYDFFRKRSKDVGPVS